jgi:queuosine precursor transporter
VNDRKQQLFLWLAGFFVASLICADLIGGKFFVVGKVHLSVGMLAFPLTFVLTDVVNEFFGQAGARRITFLGLGTAIFAFVIINVALALPTSPESPLSGDQFKTVFGWSGRLYLASLSAYVVGQLIDISVFGALRRLTRHRLLWLRATGSTLVSQAIDTVVVNVVLLSGAKTAAFIFTVIRDSYLTKVLIALALTPLIYFVHTLVLKVLKVEETSQEK